MKNGEKKSIISLKNRVGFRSRMTIPCVILLMWVILSIVTDTFLTQVNITNLFRQMSLLGICATGMTFAIISGNSDLSMGATVGLSGIVVALILRDTGNLLLAILGALVVGVCVGLFNSFVIVKMGVPSFIATLSTMTAVRGIANILSEGKTIAGLPTYFTNLSGKTIFFVPVFVVIYLVIIVITHFILNKTVFGRNLYAVGSNKEVAELSGIKVYPTIRMAYIFSGVIASICGVLVTARLASGQPTAGNGYDLQCVTAAVIGGASLGGGSGTVVGTFFGTTLIYTLTNGGNLLGVNTFWMQVVTGIMTVIAVFVDGYRRRKNANKV